MSATKYPLGLCHLGFLEIAPPGLIDLAAAAGFDAVSLRTRPVSPGAIAYPLTEPAVAVATRDRLAATGLQLWQVEIVTVDRHTDVRALQPFLEAGAGLGAHALVATGDDEPGPLAEKLDALGELAAAHGMSVDLEFMRFRRLATLASALAVVRAVGRANLRVLVDTLHLARAGGAPRELVGVPAGMIGGVQLADAPAVAPPPDRLATEAREGRLLPGDGALPLSGLLRALPSSVPLSAEVPLAAAYGVLDAPTRARRIHDATRQLIETTFGD
ncbi:MAG: hypothetical protein EA356_10875 [Geminicoccaceae bacterium]|nr:MAG: hypothetical protein EA356_10875 [Geminicoccaceae bacterium]